MRLRRSRYGGGDVVQRDGGHGSLLGDVGGAIILWVRRLTRVERVLGLPDGRLAGLGIGLLVCGPLGSAADAWPESRRHHVGLALEGP